VGPEFADGFVGCEAAEGLESSGEVVGCDEVGQVGFELFVRVVEEAFDGGFLDGSVHAFDLTIGPGMVRLGEAVFDSVDMAGPIEGMAAEAGGWPLAILGKVGELDSVVGEHGVDTVGTAAMSASRKVVAVRISAFSTSSTTANLEVRSMAPKR
jgi:hypothetical protein